MHSETVIPRGQTLSDSLEQAPGLEQETFPQVTKYRVSSLTARAVFIENKHTWNFSTSFSAAVSLNLPPQVSQAKLDQLAFLVENISGMVRSTLFDEDLVPTGKSPEALGADPYIAGFVFGIARETSRTMGIGIDTRDSIVVASSVSSVVFGKLAKPTDPKAPDRFELGVGNGEKVARFLNDDSAASDSDPMQGLWIDYVLYKYPSDEFRESEEYEAIERSHWF